jgi:hypothetical protein
MRPNHIPADTSVPKTGQHWNSASDYEPHNTIYTLAVFIPPRPPPKYLPAFLTREPLDTSPFHVIRPKSPTLDYTCFERRDLRDMRTKTVKIKSHDFPVELRCKHLVDQTVCRVGCYVLEKGGKEVRRFRCGRSDCDGHVYCGNIKELRRFRCYKEDCIGHLYCEDSKEDDHVSCFGKKGERMVCIEEVPE